MISPQQHLIQQLTLAALGTPRYDFPMVAWNTATQQLLRCFRACGDTLEEVICYASLIIEEESVGIDIDIDAFERWLMPYAQAIKGAPEGDELPLLTEGEKKLYAIVLTDEERYIECVIGPLVGVAVVDVPEQAQ